MTFSSHTEKHKVAKQKTMLPFPMMIPPLQVSYLMKLYGHLTELYMLMWGSLIIFITILVFKEMTSFYARGSESILNKSLYLIGFDFYI